MNLPIDQRTLWLVGGVIALLVVASAIGFVLSAGPPSPISTPASVRGG
jgi:hypothetical protein